MSSRNLSRGYIYAFIILPLFVALLALATRYYSTHGDLDFVDDGENFVVDLGYQLNLGSIVADGKLLTFRNIRFAAPPTGQSRFRAPTPPQTNRTKVQNATDVICPQAYPKWLTTRSTTPFTAADISPVDPRTSEDCLFLDVLLPKSVWVSRVKNRVPVLVYIHGGGFDLHWKDASGKGYGLVERSQKGGGAGVIYVAINYRLGLFGWMHGPGVAANAGLLDQRFALEWVQQYIHLFGGDPSRVTILGLSAGGSSVQAHITAYGGARTPSPFRAAIAQSPYSVPSYPSANSAVEAVMRFGEITTLEQFRDMPSDELQRLNAMIVGNSQPFGTFTFGVYPQPSHMAIRMLNPYHSGIVPDGDYVPNLPSKSLHQGRFDQSLSIMTSHCSDEGPFFSANTLVIDEHSYQNFLTSLISPLAEDASSLSYITQVLYPPIFDGTHGYTTQAERNNLTIAHAVIVCNARPDIPVYTYEFAVPPATHGGDLAYAFFDSGPSGKINITIAAILQHYILEFTKTGQPNSQGLPRFDPVGKGAFTSLKISNDLIGMVREQWGLDLERSPPTQSQILKNHQQPAQSIIPNNNNKTSLPILSSAAVIFPRESIIVFPSKTQFCRSAPLRSDLISGFGIKRAFLKERTLSDGTIIPEGAHTLMAIQPHQQGDPSIPDPQTFNAFRYFQMRQQEGHAYKHQFATTDPYTLHFGHGKYACPGRLLASVVIKLLLGRLLLDFDFRFPCDQGRPEDIRAHEYIFPSPRGKVELRLRAKSECRSLL
ncbi:MAG: hypothetical protein Q9194_003811 [Teloschistes cf. exilis]